MGTWIRSTKAGSTTSFGTSRDLGNTLLVTDLDTDINNGLGEVNGNLDNTNIKVGAGIATLKIAADGGFTNAHLSATAAIVGSKLAPGAAVRDIQSVTAATVAGVSTETDLAVLPSLSVDGGRIFLFGSLPGFASVLAGPVDITFRMKRDATTIATWITRFSPAGGTQLFPITFSPFFTESPGAGSYVYKITVAATIAAYGNIVGGTGVFFAVELS